MTQRVRRRCAFSAWSWGLVAWLLSGPAMAQSGPTAEWSSDGRMGGLVLREALAPIDEAARANGAQIISLRVVDENGSDRNLEPLSEAIGNFFWDAGYEVQIRGPRTEIAEGAWNLELVVDAATVDTPQRRGSFLGLGGSKLLRRALVSLRGRLEDPATGRWYWKGAPSVSQQSWVDEGDDRRIGEDRPEWAQAVPAPLASNGARWWEKTIVGGLLAGVVTLYFSGAN